MQDRKWGTVPLSDHLLEQGTENERFSEGTPGSREATGGEKVQEAGQGGGWGPEGVAWGFLFSPLECQFSVLPSPEVGMQ